MARQMKNTVTKFELLESEGVKENEMILEQGPHANEGTPAPVVEKDVKDGKAADVEKTPEPAGKGPEQVEKPTFLSESTEEQEADSSLSAASGQESSPVEKQNKFTLSPIKPEKGVKIMLPMEYYFKLVRLKACSGKTLQELAAQGVMEFIDKYVKD